MASRRLGSSSTTRTGRLCSDIHFSFVFRGGDRQGQYELGAGTGLGKQFDTAAMGAGDTQRDGQPQSGTLPLGGEKGLEDPRLVFPADAGAAIAHAERQQIA